MHYNSREKSSFLLKSQKLSKFYISFKVYMRKKNKCLKICNLLDKARKTTLSRNTYKTKIKSWLEKTDRCHIRSIF